MLFELSDWIILGLFFLILLSIGLWAAKSAGRSHIEFFLSGRNMPWWLLGISMVATTFSADTPNLVTGLVREGGIARNWAWWSFLITGMVTVFIYARLWRRSEVLTDLEFYELRYSGPIASFLRGFRAIYLGFFFNCLIMGAVTLAAIKIGSVMFGLAPWVIVVGGSILIGFYSVLGGLKGVIWTDFFQFSISMIGAVYAAIVAVNHPQIGSLDALFTHPTIQDKLQFFPSIQDPSLFVTILIIPIAVQWWSVWYPGAEPGGGGYIAQRMLAAKDEHHALGASLLFNVAHYAIRPWPWILVALASILVFPDLASIQAAFPNISDQYLGDDIAYPVMLTFLGPGWLGLVTASLIAAYMSTISTHLNWGSSYIVHDVYKRFYRKKASDQELVVVGRIAILILLVSSGLFALLFLENATQAFNILLLSGAGTGSIFLLRWFWWRINAFTELTAMIYGAVQAVILVIFVPDEALANGLIDGFSTKLLLAVSLTTIMWLLSMYMTPPEDEETLKTFYQKIKPNGPGWIKIRDICLSRSGVDQQTTRGPRLTAQLALVFLGSVGVYLLLFAIGKLLFGEWVEAFVLMLPVAAISWITYNFLLKNQD
jgi:Na+/proline symporter